MNVAATRGNAEAKSALARGFDGRADTASAASTLLTSQQLTQQAYAALPSLLDRQLEMFKRDHAKIPPLTDTAKAELQKKYEKSKPLGKFNCNTDAQSAYLLGRNLQLGQSSYFWYVEREYSFCAALHNVPGAMENMLWSAFLNYYNSRDLQMYADPARGKLQDYAKAASNQFGLASYMLAALEQEKKNSTLVRAYLTLAANQVPEAATDLAAMEWSGTGGPVDEASGTKLMLSAAKTDPNAMYLLGMAYAEGLHGLTADPAHGLELLTAAGAKGNTVALRAKQQIEAQKSGGS